MMVPAQEVLTQGILAQGILAQGATGVALVMCFALLATSQLAAASALLAVQSLAVAVAAATQHSPLLAAATVVIDVVGAYWVLAVLRHADTRAAEPASQTRPTPTAGQPSTGSAGQPPVSPGFLPGQQPEQASRAAAGPVAAAPTEPAVAAAGGPGHVDTTGHEPEQPVGYESAQHIEHEPEEQIGPEPADQSKAVPLKQIGPEPAKQAGLEPVEQARQDPAQPMELAPSQRVGLASPTPIGPGPLEAERQTAADQRSIAPKQHGGQPSMAPASQPLAGQRPRPAVQPLPPPLPSILNWGNVQPNRGARFGIVLGAGIAVLCQSCGLLALPLAVSLLSVLLAATRNHRLMRLIALVSLQNGITLGACLLVRPPPLALACFVLPLPFAALAAAGGVNRHRLDLPRWIRQSLGWMQLALTAGLFVASLTIRLDPLASSFVPLIAIWGIADAWASRNCTNRGLVRRGAALAKLGFMLIAVAMPYPVLVWLALAGAISAALLPASHRREDAVLLASAGMAAALFGLLTMPLGGLAGLPAVAVSWAALFIGYTAVIAVVPELGVVVMVVILRLMLQSPPPLAGTILISVATAGLIGCSIQLGLPRPSHRRLGQPRPATLVQLTQLCIIAIALGLDVPQGRFAAAVLLVLLSLTSTAVRVSRGPVAVLAAAGLRGIPPFGVFPGLVLVVLALNAEAPWLLLPVAMGLAAGLAGGSFPGRSPGAFSGWTWRAMSSAGLLPLALAFLFGFLAPNDLINWLRALTGATP